MNSLFCPSCGSKNQYALKKPEKCEKCSSALFVIQSSKITKPTKKVEDYVQPEEVEAQENFEAPAIRRIEIGPIGQNWQSIRQPGSSVVGSMVGETPHVRPRGKKVNMKKAMEEFRREASPSRESIPVGD